MKKINSRAKGQRGELLWRDVLRSKGFVARRGQQFCGANGDSDVICEELSHIHFEVKFVQNFNARKALEQAKSDAKDGQTPLVVQKSTKKDWIAVMDAEAFLDLVIKAENLQPWIDLRRQKEKGAPVQLPSDESHIDLMLYGEL